MKWPMNEGKKKKKMDFAVRTRGVLLILLIQLFVIYFPRTLLIDFLFYEDEPKNADAIILMSGDTVRIKKAAELYHAGYADKVLLTNALEAGSRPEDAESYGIPHHALLIENKAMSTYENALFSKPIILEHEIESALVVTSNYHMRRTRLAFSACFTIQM